MLISRKNMKLTLSYLLILSIVLIGYLIMIAFEVEGYHPEIYKKGYLYYIVFQFIIFSLMMIIWESSPLLTNIQSASQNHEYLKSVLKYGVNNLGQVILLSASSIPLLVIIFMVGRIGQINIFWPMLLQVFWGVVVLSLRGFLESLKIDKTWKDLSVMIFMIIIFILTLVFLYYFVEYEKLVITTVYDKDIFCLFFLNPLLTIGGLAYVQIGGTTQIGWQPIGYYLIFNSLLIVSFLMLTARSIKRRQIKEVDI